MFGKLFKPRAHYVFDYKPRYYDERKERLEKLEDKYHKNKKQDEDSPKITLSKNNLKNDWVKNKRSATDKSTNLRLAIIIAILVGIVAYIFELHKLF
ncbi:hypothetical protein MKD41_05360 [Lutibacter sp. A64]|uniref:hypothetical protein n=1 Tax=Lutibacter sp. A64 TaxID=2918526 RepID=UPI001F052CE5|nr:hypothetical protein [Lutibacter sp. A64]UMB54901.1 hypothetical protein MKD41_05360 [Lutibacter sp. A64]